MKPTPQYGSLTSLSALPGSLFKVFKAVTSRDFLCKSHCLISFKEAFICYPIGFLFYEANLKVVHAVCSSLTLDMQDFLVMRPVIL